LKKLLFYCLELETISEGQIFVDTGNSRNQRKLLARFSQFSTMRNQNNIRRVRDFKYNAIIH